MTNWFEQKEENFNSDFEKFIATRELGDDIRQKVSELIADVRLRGDEALISQAKLFDGVELDSLRLSPEHIKNLAEKCNKDVRDALNLAATRIEAWHKKQLPRNISTTDEIGISIEQVWGAIDTVGIYVPGGSARYPSSVLMNALPAKIAGCARVAAALPANSCDDPMLMAAFVRAGISEVWQMGGAGAIAAFAFGTKSVTKVDKITGPGNAYVAEAKRQVFGQVGIDMVAGPSEILVIADKNNNPDWVAADLLSQAEHDKLAQSILICDDGEWAKKVDFAIEIQLHKLPRKEIARESWSRFGAIIIVENLTEAACELANLIAAEHVELLVNNSNELAKKIRHAGTIFIGSHTPEVLGDYLIGTNHVLPTSSTARFASGLSVYDFLKRTSITHCPPASFEKLSLSAQILAKAEGLEAHQFAVAIRSQKNSINFHDPQAIKTRSQEKPEIETKLSTKDNSSRIVSLEFGVGLAAPRREELEFERKAALYDLLEENYFSSAQNPTEGHSLTLSLEEGRLVFENQKDLRFRLALAPLSRLVRDYFLLCESYYDAVKNTPSGVEQLDQARRALHDEGADMLSELLQRRGEVDTDNNTARRLFTLICVMYMR